MKNPILYLESYHHHRGEKEAIELTEEKLKQLKEVLYMTTTGELIVGPVNGEYKEIVSIDDDRPNIFDPKFNKRYCEHLLGFPPKIAQFTRYN